MINFLKAFQNYFPSFKGPKRPYSSPRQEEMPRQEPMGDILGFVGLRSALPVPKTFARRFEGRLRLLEFYNTVLGSVIK